ncbi:HNH endonuclease [Lactococcus phage ASCC532]|uniref:HNH endonuclease n=1 Tax=Lactococcus phage ASCC532 TaxID=2892351 RepID=H9EHC9_9CAUD|nr:HNH endonuclease [Lactococcus phage ASCC532]AFE88096.1 HNH endonuclease [Lactococcus phage ASCC532]
MEVVRYKEKYLVSDKGDVFKENKKYTIKKKQSTNNYGYKVTKINGKQEKVHRIVMEAFHGKSDLTVDHIDGNKENNNLTNLEYVTQTENAKRFHDKKVKWNGKEFRSFSDLAKYVGVSRQSVSKNYSKGHKLKGYIIEVVK